MSGFEIVGTIGAVIGTIGGITATWNSAQKDLKLSKTFKTVSEQLSLLEAVFNTCQEHFRSLEGTMPEAELLTVNKLVRDCQQKLDRLDDVFKQTIPGSGVDGFKRYRMLMKRLGKGNKVEELMQSVAESSQHLTNFHLVKSIQPNLSNKLDQIINTMRTAPSSLNGYEYPSQSFNNHGGQQYVSSGNSVQYNNQHHGSGPTYYAASGATYNLG